MVVAAISTEYFFQMLTRSCLSRPVIATVPFLQIHWAWRCLKITFGPSISYFQLGSPLSALVTWLADSSQDSASLVNNANLSGSFTVFYSRHYHTILSSIICSFRVSLTQTQAQRLGLLHVYKGNLDLMSVPPKKKMGLNPKAC